jgi:hypothetical protein
MRFLLVSLLLLVGCQTSSPYVAYGTFGENLGGWFDARYLLVQAGIEGEAAVRIKAHTGPVQVVDPFVLQEGGWYLVDATGEEDTLELLDGEPWPAWIYDLALLTDEEIARYGIVFE